MDWLTAAYNEKMDDKLNDLQTNKFIKTAEKIYSNYQVFHLMSEATIFLDNLSNWYIRRNRRRFWKSENDSDKTAAYSTLYQILINFVIMLIIKGLNSKFDINYFSKKFFIFV